MNISQRLRTCARHTGLDAVIELLQEAADEIDALQARAQVHWEALTPERLAFGPLAGPYWLATDAGVVLVGDYRWEQGHDPHGFDAWGGGRVKACRITHIAPFVTPTLPGRTA